MPSCMLLIQYMQKTRVVLIIFPMKRRGGVVPSCMLAIRLMQETRICTRSISYEKKGWCRALMHVVNTHAGDKSRTASYCS